MATPPDFDLAAAHRHFAADCFNRAWTLINRTDRSAEDDRLMVALNQASIYHWLQRPDCDAQKLSVGYWQAARIQALLGQPDEARRHAEVCLHYSRGLAPFYLAYAHEALARAEGLAGRLLVAAEHRQAATALAAQVDVAEERQWLLDDLDTLP